MSSGCNSVHPDFFREATLGRLREALALLEAIDDGGLLDALPPNPRDARDHQCGVSMLAVLRRELSAVVCELESAGLVHHMISRVTSVGGD